MESQRERFVHQQGQIALIVLLIMAVGLTLGVSLSSRTAMDVALSRQEQEGVATFQAAESGIEDALSKDFSTLDFSGGDITGTIAVGDADVQYAIRQEGTLRTTLEAGARAQVNVTGATTSKFLVVTWGQGDTCGSANKELNASSLLVRVYKNVAGSYTARNYAYSACDYSFSNGFPTDGVTGNSGEGYHVSIPMETGDFLVSIHVLYKQTVMEIETDNTWTLPAQFYSVTSTATHRQGNESKAIVVTKTMPMYPSVFDYTLYSGGTLAK